jgi:hypothetical protein
MANKHGPELLTDKEPTFKYGVSPDYRDNCKTGYKGPLWNAHHVVPLASMNNSRNTYLEDKDPEYELALEYFTNWDINASKNMLGLATEASYISVFKSMDKRNISSGRPKWIKPPWRHMTTPKYPIHIPYSRWKHNEYNDAVEGELDKIWINLKVKHEKHVPTKADDLGSAIQGISNTHRGKLQGKVQQTIEDWKAKKYAQFYMV